jgi:hypothetical protein
LQLLKRHNIFTFPAIPKNFKKAVINVIKTFLPILAIALFSAIFYPMFKAAPKKAAASVSTLISTTTAHEAKNTVEARAIMASTLLYDSLNLDQMGLSAEALQYAYEGYLNLVERGAVNNTNVLTVCDFSQSSKKKRMYIIDVKNFKVLLNTYVAHGKNSGLDMAQRFSNKMESLQSSLGFYVTKSTYHGKHGLSLKLDGQEQGYNDKAEARAVVVHGAEYIGDQRLGSGYMGRSFGCPAVPQQQAAKVINYIKGGTCLFIYHPSANYLKSSRLLNA